MSYSGEIQYNKVDKEETGDQQKPTEMSIVTENENESNNNNNKPKVTRNKRRHKKLSKTQQRILWRRNKIQDYLIKGLNLHEIADQMQISYKTIWDDYNIMRQEAKENMQQNHVADLPIQIKLACASLNQVIKILYEIQDLDNAIQRRTSDNVRVLALSQIREAIKLKLEILTSQSAVEDALKFVESTKQLKIVKDKFAADMQQVREQDQQESLPMMDALTNEKVNNGNNIMELEGQEGQEEEEDKEELQQQALEEENEIASQYSEPITEETILKREREREQDHILLQRQTTTIQIYKLKEDYRSMEYLIHYIIMSINYTKN